MPEPPISPLARVRQVLERLLDPTSGCPWDLKQTPATLKQYLLEETYELLDAVESGDPASIRDEMGDCLFIICFLARLFEAQGEFDVEDALTTAANKIIFRHPHIFANGRTLKSPEEVKVQWDALKRQEKSGSLLQGVPRHLPALMRAHRLTERAGRVGFDWSETAAVLTTLEQEIGELRDALDDRHADHVRAELGDVLFTLANLGRHLKVNAEDALSRANDRFTARFQYMEQAVADQGKTLEELTLAEMDRLWAEAKAKGL